MKTISYKNSLRTIKYNGKEYRMPFHVALPDDPTATDTVKE